ncbi:MAG: MoaD/ThiS family protein [Phycisphaeraceae bacterium]|nr:MoaD/ThiS family protein [Phycisphaeraceae bacterium]
MRLRVRLFGAEARVAGADEMRVDVPDDPTAAGVLAAIGVACPALRDSLSHSRLAVNHEFAPSHASVQPGDEIALIGLVSGG